MFYITSLAFHLLVVVAGVVVFALTVDLLNISSTNQPEILRSNPPMPVLNVTAIVANGNMSIVEEFPILDPDEAFLLGPLTFFAVFKYDESSSTILLNFAFVNRNATAKLVIKFQMTATVSLCSYNREISSMAFHNQTPNLHLNLHHPIFNHIPALLDRTSSILVVTNWTPVYQWTVSVNRLSVVGTL